MFAAIKQFFVAITTLFAALEKVAKSIDNLAEVGNIKSESFLDEARADKAKTLKALEAEANS